jgi:hypothetical protein
MPRPATGNIAAVFRTPPGRLSRDRGELLPWSGCDRVPPVFMRVRSADSPWYGRMLAGRAENGLSSPQKVPSEKCPAKRAVNGLDSVAVKPGEVPAQPCKSY